MFKRLSFFILAILLSSGAYSADKSSTANKPSILFINIDDLNDWNEVLGGHPQAITPNLKRLADMGTTFTRSIASSPVCFPSRTAVFSGIHPSRSGAISNFNWDKGWRFYVPDAVTLPKHFSNQGWTTFGGGKNFHGKAQDEFDHSFNDTSKSRKDPVAVKGTGYDAGPFGWGVSSVPYEQMADHKTVSWGIKQLQENSGPVFLSVGIYKPHVKWILPQPSFDKYPLETFIAPAVQSRDLDDLPARFKLLAHNEAKFDKGYHQKLKKDGQVKLFARAYLAAVTFADEQLGRLLNAWQASAHAQNGIIVLWSDHGFMLGEKEGWGKFKPWFDAVHTNMIFAGKGIAKGMRFDNAVSLQDLYPTIVELAGISKPTSHLLDGNSLLPFFSQSISESKPKSKLEWDKPVMMSHEEDGIRYDVVMNNQFRMTKAITSEVELYDLNKNPHEWHNLATQPQYASVIESLSKHLSFRHPSLTNHGWLEAEDLPYQTSADYQRRGNFNYPVNEPSYSGGRAICARLKKGAKSYIEFVVDVKTPGKYQLGADVQLNHNGAFKLAIADVINDEVQASAKASMTEVGRFDSEQLKDGVVNLGQINVNSAGLKLIRFSAVDNSAKEIIIDRILFKQE